MAKITNPLFSHAASGPLARAVGYVAQQGGAIARALPQLRNRAPTNPPTTEQSTQRERYASAAAAWHALTPQQRGALNADAALLGLTGYNLWLRQQLAPTPPSPYTAATLAFFDAADIPQHTQRATDYDTIIRALQAANVWARIDMLFLFAATTTRAALTNLRDPAGPTATAVNSPNHTPDRGYTGSFPGNGHLRLGRKINQLTHYTRNSAYLYAYNTNAKNLWEPLLGTYPPGYNTVLWGVTADNKEWGRINSTVGFGPATIYSPAAHATALSRTASNAAYLYRDAARIAQSSTASVQLDDAELSALRHYDTYSSKQIAAAVVGAGMSDADHTAIHTAVTAYLTSVGAI
jgi:hypothetical protein